MAEQLPEPERRMTSAQEETLRDLCERYHVEYDPSHYYVWPEDSVFTPGFAEGWLGGREHSPFPSEGPVRLSLYVGVDPEGRAHS